jgi:hypothetical protein
LGKKANLRELDTVIWEEVYPLAVLPMEAGQDSLMVSHSPEAGICSAGLQWFVGSQPPAKSDKSLVNWYKKVA